MAIRGRILLSSLACTTGRLCSACYDKQGNNGVEPPMFDKLVEQAEAEIAVLKKPAPHKYELVRVEEKK